MVLPFRSDLFDGQRDQQRGRHRQQRGTEAKQHVGRQHRTRHFLFAPPSPSVFSTSFGSSSTTGNPSRPAEHRRGDRAVDRHGQQRHVPRDQHPQAVAPRPDADMIDVGFGRHDHVGQSGQQFSEWASTASNTQNGQRRWPPRPRAARDGAAGPCRRATPRRRPPSRTRKSSPPKVAPTSNGLPVNQPASQPNIQPKTVGGQPDRGNRGAREAKQPKHGRSEGGDQRDAARQTAADLGHRRQHYGHSQHVDGRQG